VTSADRCLGDDGDDDYGHIEGSVGEEQRKRERECVCRVCRDYHMSHREACIYVSWLYWRLIVISEWFASGFWK